MELYSLVVESFTIHDTRSPHNDSVFLNVSTFVDGDLVDTWSSKKLGDYNNGTYSTPTAVRNHPPVVINDPQATAQFIFQLVNNGNVSDSVFNSRAAATADQLAGLSAGAIGTVSGGWGFVIGLAVEAIANLWAWLSTDCDGPVGVDQIAGPRYLIDEQTDNVAHAIQVTKNYRGGDMPSPCGNSNYDITWYLHHNRTWVPVADADTQLSSLAGVTAAAHNGMLHCFGVGTAGVNATHAVTLKGASWAVDQVGDFALATNLPLSAVSFDDRLHLFGVDAEGKVLALLYTEDGGSWYEEPNSPPDLKTEEAVATVEFLDRLYVFARDGATNHLRVTSSSDLRVWLPWVDVPAGGLVPHSAVAAAALGGTLHLFGIYDTGKKPAHVVVHTSTKDGLTWTAWDMVEAGLTPLDEPSADPLDVAAGIHEDRVYVAVRWQWTDSGQTKTAMGLNFSGDGQNWSGWRTPWAYDMEFQPSAPTAIAAVHNHLYIVSRRVDPDGDPTQVWAY
jgi:hypothetical protein